MKRTSPNMRDLEVIDSELWLLLAIRQMVREEEGRPPSTARIDELLDERSAAAARTASSRRRPTRLAPWWSTKPWSAKPASGQLAVSSARSSSGPSTR
ncbi:MAG TPA: hypothetical protein VNW96_05565 [Mycobacterium sp.]|nr:hypothetical protein [Mycobacterium sp.]